MLHMRDTRITLTRHANVLPGVRIAEEGVALSYVKHNGDTYVQPSTGAAGEIFAGISMERFAPARSLPFIREYELDASGTIQLPRTPIAGQLAIFERGVVLSVAAGTEAPEEGANAIIDGDVLLFAAEGAAGRVVRVQMSYTPDMEEARTLQGDIPFGGHASDITGVIGRILDGEVATSCIDMSKDWTDALSVGLAADGNFIPATAQNRVQGVVVKNSPNAANPYLVISVLTA